MVIPLANRRHRAHTRSPRSRVGDGATSQQKRRATNFKDDRRSLSPPDDAAAMSPLSQTEARAGVDSELDGNPNFDRRGEPKRRSEKKEVVGRKIPKHCENPTRLTIGDNGETMVPVVWTPLLRGRGGGYDSDSVRSTGSRRSMVSYQSSRIIRWGVFQNVKSSLLPSNVEEVSREGGSGDVDKALVGSRWSPSTESRPDCDSVVSVEPNTDGWESLSGCSEGDGEEEYETGHDSPSTGEEERRYEMSEGDVSGFESARFRSVGAGMAEGLPSKATEAAFASAPPPLILPAP